MCAALIRVLVVADAPAVCARYRASLVCGSATGDAAAPGQQGGPETFDAVICADAPAALTAVERSLADARPFAVAFLDLQGPLARTGVWVATRLRALDPRLDLVLVAACRELDPAAIAGQVPPPERLFYLEQPFHFHEVRQLASALGRRRRVEAQLAAAVAAAQAADAAKSRFLATMSHELRTPLNAILNMNDLLLESALTPEQHAHAAIARESAHALLAIVNGVLDFSKIESGRVEPALIPCDPEDIIRRVIDLLAARAKSKEIALTLVFDPDLPLQLHTDPGLVRQILLNLIGNAIRFTDAGAVRLRVGPATRLTGEPAWRCDVIDTGVGIPPAAQGRLFKEFVQVDASDSRRHGGSGLGLAISRRLARLLGGDITMTSTPGEGSCFTLQLPLVPTPLFDQESEQRSEPAAGRGENRSDDVTGEPLAAVPNPAAASAPASVATAAAGRRALAASLRPWQFGIASQDALIGADLLEQLTVFGLNAALLPTPPWDHTEELCGEILLAPGHATDVPALAVSPPATAVASQRATISEPPANDDPDPDHPGSNPSRAAISLAGDLPRRVWLYPLGTSQRERQPPDVVARLRLPVVPSVLLQRLVEASTAAGPLPDCDLPPLDRLLPRLAQVAANAQTILLAEDSRANQLVAITLLGRAGFRVDLAENGLQAVASVNRQQYALVLMDLAMPEMDGIEATGCIRSLPGKRGRLPIIAMTASVFDEDRARCLAAGMDDYLTKPIEREALYQTLLRWLDPVPAAAAATAAIPISTRRSPGPTPTPTATVGPQVLRPRAAAPAQVATPAAVSTSPSPMVARPDAAADRALPKLDAAMPATLDQHLSAALLSDGAATLPVLDDAVLAVLEQDLSAELMPDVVATFIDETTARIAAIRQAAATGDGTATAAQAHGLKGSAATFGARTLGASAQAIEVAGHAGDLGSVQTLVARLPAQGQAVIMALRSRHPVPGCEPTVLG